MKFFAVFSHEFTEEQKEAVKQLGCGEIVYMPEDLKTLWASIPPEEEFIGGFIKPLKEWLEENSRSGDYVLIQGDFGAVFHLVDYCFHHGLKPVYSTTKREHKEEKQADGSVKVYKMFKHCRFREYEKYE